MRAIALAAALGAAACASPPGAGPPPASWRLVEREEGLGRRLLLEREAPRVLVRLLRERAQVGETTEAEVWLPGGEGRRRIEVRPGRPEVSVRGPREFEVEGARPVRVRFTCGAPGPGGIVVVVKE